MFKKFRLNKRYSFNLRGEFTVDGKTVEPNGSNNTVPINVGDSTHHLCPKWLGLICHFEVDLPLNDLLKIRFVDCYSRLLRFKCNKMMVFKKPVYYKTSFRVVPNLTRYAVSENGEFVSIESDKKLAVGKGPNGYPVVNVYDPDKGRYRQIGLHIVVARAWVHNDDPITKLTVNHKDGNKLNFCPKNLEWVDGTTNNIHARDNGFKSDNIKCSIYDYVTDNLIDCHSLSEASVWLGFRRSSLSTHKVVGREKVPRIFKSRYMVFKENELPESVHLKKLFEEVSKKKNKGPYEAEEYATGIVYEADTRIKLGKMLGLSKGQVEYGLKAGPEKVTGRFRFREKINEPWPTIVTRVVRNKPKVFFAEKDGLVKKYGSLNGAVKDIGCDKSTILKRLNDPTFKRYEGWRFYTN